MADTFLAAAEVIARQVYFRWPRNHKSRSAAKGKHRSGPRAAVRVKASELSARLREIGAQSGGLLMVHSSVDNLKIVADDGQVKQRGAAVLWLLEALESAIGPDGTLCMPTHPLYKDDPGFMYDKSDLVLHYSVRKTPSKVGLLTEFFRRQPGTLRSLHPLSSLAARGPLAAELLKNNLNDQRPLPHGVHSGYYRFCQRDGLVISLGVPLFSRMTVTHVAEEVKDADWPTQGFFYERPFEVEDEQGNRRRVTVRERRPEYVRSFAQQVMRRHFLGADILHEGAVGPVRLDTASSLSVLNAMREKQERSSFPYFFPVLAGIGAAPPAASN